MYSMIEADLHFLGKLENALSTCPKVGFLQKCGAHLHFPWTVTPFCLSNACPSCPPLPPLPRRYRQKGGGISAALRLVRPPVRSKPCARYRAFLMLISVVNLADVRVLRESYQMVFRPVSCRSDPQRYAQALLLEPIACLLIQHAV
jgi:hypothetical protein